MERRYLIATLALAATFAVFSHGWESGYLAKVPRSRAELAADVTCAKRYVAEQVVARLEPLLDRTGPEQAQMVAELNLPEVVRVAQSDAQSQVLLAQQHLAEQKCSAAMRAQREALRTQERARERALEIQVRTSERVQELRDLAVVRAEELSERANERALKINAMVVGRAQDAASRAMEHAQCSTQKSRTKTNRPPAPSMPIHVNFQVPASSFTFTIPAIQTVSTNSY